MSEKRPIADLKGRHRGETALVLCPGLTLEDYDDASMPDGVVRIYVEDAILKAANSVGGARYWVASDSRVVDELKDAVPPGVIAVVSIADVGLLDGTAIRVAAPVEFGDGGDLSEGGSAAVSGLSLAALLGCARVFAFGLDLYRLKDRYGFNQKRSRHISENRVRRRRKVKKARIDGRDIFRTPRMRRASSSVDALIHGPQYDGREAWCVASPFSQQLSMPKISLLEFMTRVGTTTSISYDTSTNTTPPSSIFLAARRPGRPRKEVAGASG